MLGGSADLGLEADSILGFVGTGLFAYGIGSRHFGIGGVGALMMGWFGGLALARVGGLTAAVNSLQTSIGGQGSTTSTNGSSTGTP